MDQDEHCQCSRPDLCDTGDHCCCISCGLTAQSETKLPLKHKTEDAEFLTNERAAPPSFSGNTFSYNKLRHASEFRLFCLSPGSHEDEIAGELFHANISYPPDYEAVSYTWGDTTLTQEISTEKGPIKITANCLSALKGLRHVTRKRILWVDAICIAQADDLEKNHQIPLMPRIYAEAMLVLIYVGDHASVEDTKALFALLRQGSKTPLKPTDRKHIAEFLSLPWFSRIWVLQEVAMARQAEVVVGSTALDWRHLSVANIGAVGLEPTNLEGDIPAVLQLSENDKKPIRNVVSLISKARSCLSNDPRDRIYALLGMVDRASGISLTPDYTKSVGEVYTDVTIQFLRAYNCLGFLSDIGYCVPQVDNIDINVEYKTSLDPAYLFGISPMAPEIMEEFHEDLDLPSWVPDFRYHPRVHSLAHWRPSTFPARPVASCHAGSANCPTPSLEVKAIFIEIIESRKFTAGENIRLCNTTIPISLHPVPKLSGFCASFKENLIDMNPGVTFDAICRFSSGRRVVLTDTSLAIVPGNFNIGDVIAILYGGTVPYLLRRSRPEPDIFYFVGECYLHGVKGPQFAPNYAELLGWFKDRVIGEGEQDGLPWRTIFLE